MVDDYRDNDARQRAQQRAQHRSSDQAGRERGRTTGGCFRISLKAILHIGHVGGSCTCAQCSIQPKQKRCSQPLISPRSSTGLRRVNTAPMESCQASGASTWSWSCALEADAAARVSVGAVGAALEHAALLQVVVHRTAKPAPQHKNQNATVELPGGARVTSSALATFAPPLRGGEAQAVSSKLGDVTSKEIARALTGRSASSVSPRLVNGQSRVV